MTVRTSLLAACAAATALLGLTVSTSAATSAAATSGTEHLTVLSTSPNGTPITIGRGPLHAVGKDIVVNAHRDRFVFPKGAIVVRHHATKSKDFFDKVTCYGRHTEQGTYTVLFGTRAYSHARGHGTYVVDVRFVGCAQNKPPRLFELKIDAVGPMSL